MAAVSFYDFTPVAIDNSPNTVAMLLNTAEIVHVRAATNSEVGNFPTAVTAVRYREIKQSGGPQLRTALSTIAYATWKTALQA